MPPLPVDDLSNKEETLIGIKRAIILPQTAKVPPASLPSFSRLIFVLRYIIFKVVISRSFNHCSSARSMIFSSLFSASIGLTDFRRRRRLSVCSTVLCHIIYETQPPFPPPIHLSPKWNQSWKKSSLDEKKKKQAWKSAFGVL